MKKTKTKLDLLNNIDMLLMVEKGIKGGLCHSIYWYATANNKYIKVYDKSKESAYPDVNNRYGCVMSQKLLVNNFEWITGTFQFNEGFIKKYSKESKE